MEITTIRNLVCIRGADCDGEIWLTAQEAQTAATTLRQKAKLATKYRKPTKHKTRSA